MQAASADAAAGRARGAAQAVAFAGEHAAIYGFRSGTAGRDPDAGAGYGREPGGHRNYSEHAREDDRNGAANGRVRASGATGIVAGGGFPHAGKTAPPSHCAATTAASPIII